MAANRRRKLKNALFRRYGWTDPRGQRFAWCAFDCGTLLTYDTATIDRYPIPGRNGGTYHLNNTRLACAPCNCADGGHNSDMKAYHSLTEKQKRSYKRALRHPKDKVQITPEQWLSEG